ncbi:efflux RND transporter periplasmic adaptor subunit [Citromicrobium bathyomarinum]
MKWLLPLVGAGLLAACSSGSQPPANDPTANVEVASVQLGAIDETLTVYGDISADTSLRRDLVAPLEAQITRISAPFGSLVQRGQPVVYLRPSPQSRLEVAQAATAATQANEALARARRLRADGLMSDADVESAQASASSANALVGSLQSRNYTLRSPAEGTVTAVDFAVGDIIAAGTTIAQITVDSDVRARFGIDPSLARSVRVGDTIRVTPTSGGTTFATQIIAVDPIVDPVTRLASVFARVSGSTEIAPGEPLKGEIVISSRPNALTVPQAALLDDAGQKYVFTVVSGKAKRVDVTIGATDGGRVEILSGLRQGDQVVTTGAAGVSDGVAVTIGPPAAPSSPSPAPINAATASPRASPSANPTATGDTTGTSRQQ